MFKMIFFASFMARYMFSMSIINDNNLRGINYILKLSTTKRLAMEYFEHQYDETKAFKIKIGNTYIGGYSFSDINLISFYNYNIRSKKLDIIKKFMKSKYGINIYTINNKYFFIYTTFFNGEYNEEGTLVVSSLNYSRAIIGFIYAIKDVFDIDKDGVKNLYKIIPFNLEGIKHKNMCKKMEKSQWEFFSRIKFDELFSSEKISSSSSDIIDISNSSKDLTDRQLCCNVN